MNTIYVGANYAGSNSNLRLSLAQIQMLTCMILNMLPTALGREMSLLSATPLFWGRAVVPEVSCRLLSTEERAHIQAGLRGICGS